MKYKAIVCDVDDTLTEGREDALPSKRVIEAVKKVQQHGIIFTLATGRPLMYVKKIIKALELKNPLIVEGGAIIYHPGEKRILWQSVIKSDTANEILRILSQKPYTFATMDGGERYINPKKTINGKITKIGVYAIPPKQAEILIDQLEELGVHAVVSSGWSGKDKVFIHITNHNATKQQAILKLANYLKISTKEIIGIGDHYNDFSMLMACGFKVAMGNAIDDLKAIADVIVSPLEEDGVAEVIEQFVLNRT